jgi:hypothetical protein
MLVDVVRPVSVCAPAGRNRRTRVLARPAARRRYVRRRQVALQRPGAERYSQLRCGAEEDRWDLGGAVGEGSAIALSPDGKWAIGNVPSPALGDSCFTRRALVSRSLGHRARHCVSDIDRLDNGRLLPGGSEPDRRRGATRRPSGGPPQAATAAGITRGRTHATGEPSWSRTRKAIGCFCRSGDQADALIPRSEDDGPSAGRRTRNPSSSFIDDVPRRSSDRI